MIAELCKGLQCVDLGESFQTHIHLQNLASIQPRTSRSKLADTSEQGCSQADSRSGGWKRDAGAFAAGAAAPAAETAAATSESVGWQNVARFRLYRLRFLQENMRSTAFFKIYQILELKFLKFDKIF